MSRGNSPDLVRWAPWLLGLQVLLAAAYLFWDVQRPFNQTDEFLYSTVAQNMLDSGDFLTPRFAHIDLLTKPPVYYWLTTTLLGLTDDAALSARLIPGLSLLGLMILSFFVGRRHFGDAVGLLAALALFLCYDHLYNHVYKSGVMEGLLNLFIAAAVFMNPTLVRQPGNIRWIAALIALAFMTKSAFAVIPAGLTTVNLLAHRAQIRITPRLWLESAGVMLVIILPWFLVAAWVHGAYLFEYMFLDQVFKRAVNDTAAAASTGRSFGRGQSLYVLRHYLEYGQPWSVLVWPALIYAWGLSRAAERPTAILLRLCVFWIVGVLALFLLSRGRWSWYISSIYIPTALLVALMLRDFVRRPAMRFQRLIWATMILSALVSVTPYVANPLAGSSGGTPLRLDFLQQLSAFGLASLVVVLLWRYARSVDARGASRWVVIGVPALTAGVVAVYLGCSLEPARSVMLPVYAVIGFLLIGAGLAGLMTLRGDERARAASVVCLFLIATGYVLAPMRHSIDAPVRREVAWVQGQIDSGRIEREGTISASRVSLFAFIPVYATFRNDYIVAYDPASGVLRIEPKRSHAPTPRT